MAVIINLAPTTELEAVNGMLRAIGEAPILDLATATQSDVDMAVAELRDTTREVLTAGWKFNIERGLAVMPSGTYSWVGTDGSTALLNVFKKPAKTLGWSVTKCRQNGDLDLTERMSKKYQETGANVMVLYNNTKNRDGALASTYPMIYLDAILAFDYEQLPEEARRYIAILAGRRFITAVAPDANLVSYSETTLRLALRALVRAHGNKGAWNVMNTVEALGISGYRYVPGGTLGRTVYPGSV